MNTGQTFIDIPYTAEWIDTSLRNLNGFLWLYEWGMYLFLVATLAVMFWVFYDSMNKKKDAKALMPRILTIVGFFLVIPAFIFRFTGNADGVTVLVRLNSATGATTTYPSAINWNVNWLVSGYGSMIAILALVGVMVSVVGLIIYTSMMEKARPGGTIFGQMLGRMNQIENKVDDISNQQVNPPVSFNQPPYGNQPMGMDPNAGMGGQPMGMGNQPMGGMGGQPMGMGNSSLAGAVGAVTANNAGNQPHSTSAATIIDRKPNAATIIDVAPTGDTLVIQTGNNRGTSINLPAKDMTVGRDDSCDIVVEDGKVSREHARFIYNNGSWIITDTNSANGTYLNGQKLRGQVALVHNDQVKIGDTVLVFGQAQGQQFPQDQNQQFNQNQFV